MIPLSEFPIARLLTFFKDFEVYIYLLLGLGGVIYISQFMRAWREMGQAAFGLEHESAQRRLNRSATGLLFFIILASLEFVLVYFVSPIVPDVSPLFTPTLNVLATQTITLAPTTPSPNPVTNAEDRSTGTVIPNAESTPRVNCIADKINITSPASGSGVSGVVQIQGTADVDNFGFYKFEFSSPGQTNWQAILAWTSPKRDDMLGQWDTSRLTGGIYLLRLVVTDNQGRNYDPCVIQVSVMKPPPQ